MSATELQSRLARRPFEPFRIRLSSGDVYDLRHPENALLLRHGIYVALPSPDEALPDRAVWCSLLHVAAIESVGSNSTSTN